jgi:hypothetical protein
MVARVAVLTTLNSQPFKGHSFQYPPYLIGSTMNPFRYRCTLSNFETYRSAVENYALCFKRVRRKKCFDVYESTRE